MLRDAVCQPVVGFGVNPVQAGADHGQRQRLACGAFGQTLQGAFMGGTIHPQSQAADHRQAGLNQRFGKVSGIARTLRRWVAASDHGQAALRLNRPWRCRVWRLIFFEVGVAQQV